MKFSSFETLKFSFKHFPLKFKLNPQIKMKMNLKNVFVLSYTEPLFYIKKTL